MNDPERICDVELATWHRGPTDRFPYVRHITEPRQRLTSNSHSSSAWLENIELGYKRGDLRSPSPASGPKVSHDRLTIETSRRQGRKVLGKDLV